MVKLLALISFIQEKKRSSKAKGRVERQNVDGLLAPEIPWDLMVEILTRLPAKSLMRFKCVSKIWSLFICSRYFSNLYLMVVSPRRPPCLYISLLDRRYVYDSIKVWHSPRESQLLLLSSWTSNSDESFDLDLTMPGMGGKGMVVLRGLILYIVCGKACIYNPTTRQSITLPLIKPITFSQKVKGCRRSVHYLFGHDPVLDQYKIICIVNVFSRGLKSFTSVHWVYVLESGGFWKRIDYQPHLLTRRGLCISGVIYYFAYTSNSSCHVLVSFDVRSEQLNMIQVPQGLSGLIFDNLMDLIEYGGKPTIFDHTYLVLMGNVDLWVLEDGGKWSKKSLVLQPSQMNLLDESIALVVIGTTQYGEVILAPSKLFSNYYFLYYDLQKNDMRKVNVGVTSDHWLGKPYAEIILIDENESILHLET